MQENDLKKLKAKDQVFIASLVDEHTDYLYYLAKMKGFNSEKAEDIVQVVWLRFLSACSDFEGRSSVKTFLLGILFNVCREGIRAEQKERKQDVIDDMVEMDFDQKGNWQAQAWQPEAELWRAEIKKSLHLCIENLDDKYREVFLLKEISGEETDNICNLLGIQSTNLGVLLFRARNYLKKCLEAKLHA